MKFNKVANVAFFSKYTREDGKITIESKDIEINGHYKNVFIVTDENNKQIDICNKLKEAKEKYSI
jgi:hypothetical protein